MQFYFLKILQSFFFFFAVETIILNKKEPSGTFFLRILELKENLAFHKLNNTS